MSIQRAGANRTLKPNPTKVFLEELRIDYGPASLLGRFFLQAESYVRSTGIKLAFGPLAEAADVQGRNVASWALYPPMLDCRLSAIDPGMSYGLLGYDEHGNTVCTQGGRIYDTGTSSLAEMIADQSFFYGPGHSVGPEMPRCSITAPAASKITGRFVYSGALWVHPDYRGHRLAAILPRISRAYALARWNTEYTIALVSHKIAASPLLKMYGYSNIQPDFSHLESRPHGHDRMPDVDGSGRVSGRSSALYGQQPCEGRRCCC